LSAKYWLGKKGSNKGTLGDLKPGDEIPENFLTEKRLREFERDGSVGEKIVATKLTDDSKTNKIKDLIAENSDLKIKINGAESKINGLDALVKKLESDPMKEKLDEALNSVKELKKEVKRLKKKAGEK